jgi:hypothetical protein
VVGNELAVVPPPTIGEDDVDYGTDSNKKRKSDVREISSGSADQAAATEQSRQTQ